MEHDVEVFETLEEIELFRQYMKDGMLHSARTMVEDKLQHYMELLLIDIHNEDTPSEQLLNRVADFRRCDNLQNIVMVEFEKNETT